MIIGATILGLVPAVLGKSLVAPAPWQASQWTSVQYQESPPPIPEPTSITSLPLPPVTQDNSPGGCTLKVNPRGTGCIAASTELQAGSFLPDGDHVLATITFAGARNDTRSSQSYSGKQVIIVKANGGAFPNGDPWKCITCGAHDYSSPSVAKDYSYPQAFSDGRRVLAGAYVLECSAGLTSDECGSNEVSIYPIRMDNQVDRSGPGAALRELRLHPDQVHLGFNVFSFAGGQLGQNTFTARLRFNPNPMTGEPLAPRYELDHVNQLSNPSLPPPISVNGSQLFINQSAITVGELRGFTGTGKEVTYVGYPFESCNIDVMAADLHTGKVRRLTSHPGYVDPIQFSPDDHSFVIMDTRGSNRTEFMAGMRGIPPIVDILTVTACASVRNNGPRRFFQPWLLDRDGDRGDYYGQEINNASQGTLGSGSVDDPNWNSMADPWFSPDGTKIVYWQAQTVQPACGGEKPLPCFESTEPGGRTERIMVAHLTCRKPLPTKQVQELPDVIPWATPYIAGQSSNSSKSITPSLPLGSYTLPGQCSGHASIQILSSQPNSAVPDTIRTHFESFSHDGVFTIDGTQNITLAVQNLTLNKLDWYTDLVRRRVGGEEESRQMSGREGFHMAIDAMTNVFEANGTLVTTVGDVVYRQPGDGM